jgi:uncharacterized protein with von Willebrand factor type A (vWA) domain
MSATLAPFPTDFPAAPISRRLVGYLRLARDNGFAVGVREGLDALRLARAVDLSRPHQLRWGLRALLCSRKADWARFDELFDAYWLRRGMKRAALIDGETGRHGASKDLGGAGGLAEAPAREGNDAAAAPGSGKSDGASTAETLSTTDFRHLNDPDQLAQVYALTERLAARMRARLTRRERQRRKGHRLDLRNTIHKSLGTSGVPMRLAFRARRAKPLRLVAILDVSGSMSLYSTFFLRFLRGVIDNFHDAEAFVFHTRLVHISPALRERDFERALERMSLISAGWSGGTRIGDSLATFNDNYAAQVLNSRSVVMIVSDGYDTGAPEKLAGELARLRRRAKRVIWLNPMIGWRDYEPVARGMTAALPHLDLFAPAHNLESLAALEPYLARL